MSLIFVLYNAIVLPVLIEWIDDTDLCYLDTAVCSRQRRTGFLSLLSSCKIVNIDADRTNVVEYYEWIKRRGLKLKSIYLDRYDLKNPLFVDVLSELNYSKIAASCSATLRDLNVHSLKVNGNDEEKLVKDLLGSVRGVQHLDISQNYSLSGEFWSSLFELCPHLTSLTVNYKAQMLNWLEHPELQSVFGCDLSDLFGPLRSITGLANTGNIRRVHALSPSVKEFKGNYWMLTDLVYNMTDAEASCVIPFLEHLQSFKVVERCSHLLEIIMTKCCHLTCLDVADEFNETLMTTYLQGAVQLKELHLRSHAAHCSVLNTAALHCKNLEVLTFDGRNLSELVVITLFKSCLQLTRADLKRCSVTDKTIGHLARNLEVLNMRGYSEAMVQCLNTRLGRQLVVVSESVTGNINYTRLFSYNQSLLRVELSFLKELKNSQLKETVKQCPLLESILIRDCREITDISCLAACKRLLRLHVEAQYSVTDAQVETVIKGKPSLLKLSLPRCPRITNVTLKLLSRLCPKLRHLSVSENKRIDSDDIIVLLQSCRNLDVLVVTDCINVDCEILTVLSSKRMRYVSCIGSGISRDEWKKFLSSTGFTSAYFY